MQIENTKKTKRTTSERKRGAVMAMISTANIQDISNTLN